MPYIPLIEFTRRLFTCGGISREGIWKVPLYCVQLIFSLLAGWLQAVIFNRRIRRTKVPHPPVFILGYFRSGTTLLQKLMAADPAFGVLTNYDCFLPRLNLLLGRRAESLLQRIIHLLRIKNPFFHDKPLLLKEAAEEDDYLMNRASPYTAYWGMVFPRKWREWLGPGSIWARNDADEGWERELQKTVQYLTFKSGGKRLVLKSPPNTGRIRHILKLFPGTKFVYLYRNPYSLYFSVRNMWKQAILPYYSLQKISAAELDELIFSHVLALTRKYEEDKALIPSGNLIELDYESLCRDPADCVKKVYDALDLPWTADSATAIDTQLQQEKRYIPFTHDYVEKDLDTVERRWGELIRRHGHTRTVTPLAAGLRDNGPTPASHPG